MSLKSQINDDLKIALLGGDKEAAITLRGLKSSILNKEVETGTRDQGLDDESIVQILKKEVKSRLESAELYKKGDAQDKADKELSEIKLIEKYIPEAMSEEEVSKIVDAVLSEMGKIEMKQMGQAIGAVKEKAGPTADGSLIAKLVKERVQS
ncbi:MAG: GatB/YqeY domain-containing protein [bacterium]|nr:GatB/YqeY domain-containing protein [bacterium]